MYVWGEERVRHTRAWLCAGSWRGGGGPAPRAPPTSHCTAPASVARGAPPTHRTLRRSAPPTAAARCCCSRLRPAVAVAAAVVTGQWVPLRTPQSQGRTRCTAHSPARAHSRPARGSARNQTALAVRATGLCLCAPQPTHPSIHQRNTQNRRREGRWMADLFHASSARK
jgi:hypothetical protein